MINIKNIKQTQKAKEEYDSPLLIILQQPTSKQELMNILNKDERTVRVLVQELSMHYPVISRSQKGAGYRLAKNINDLTDEELVQELHEVNECLAEIESRKKALKKREYRLIRWSKAASKRLGKESA